MATIDIINAYTDTVKNNYQFHFDESFYKKTYIDNYFDDFSQTIILSINNYLTNYYKKDYIDNKLINYYTVTQIDNDIFKFFNYYTKEEINEKLSINEDDIIVTLNDLTTNFYNKNEINEKLLNIKLKKDEFDNLLIYHVDSVKKKIEELLKNYITKEEIDNTSIELQQCEFNDITHKPDIKISLSQDIFGDLEIHNMNYFGLTNIQIMDNSHLHNDTYYLKNEFDYYMSLISDLNHNHNDIYFTYIEINDMLNRKSNISHIHDNTYYKKFEFINLYNSKSEIEHNHNDPNNPDADVRSGNNFYYKKEYIDNNLKYKSNIKHNHDNIYYVSEGSDFSSISYYEVVDLINKYFIVTEDQFVNNYLYNKKSLKNHNHDDTYLTKINIRGF